MSGLLARLVARAHGTLAEVAPRPVSRFENDAASGDLEIEESVLETVPTRRSPPPAAAPPADPSAAAPPAAAAPTPVERKAPAPPAPAVPPSPTVARPPPEPAHQAAPATAAPGPPPETLRQVEHRELRIEREVRREIVRASDSLPADRPHASPAVPVVPPPAPAAVHAARLVEIVERITGRAPAAERVPERAPAPQPQAMAQQASVIAAPPLQREASAPVARRNAATRRLAEPDVPAPVHVHIDRIEVRTAPAAKPRAAPRARQQPTDTAPSLQAFLAGHKAGGP